MAAKTEAFSFSGGERTMTMAPVGGCVPVEAITLANGSGVEATVLDCGATLHALRAPDRAGHVADVLLGYDDPSDYINQPALFGSIVGRCANRISGASFAIDDVIYNLPRNDRGHSLHGGFGFDRVRWRIVETGGGSAPFVRLSHHSIDGDQGYPGNLDVSVKYMLDPTGSLSIDITASTDRATIVNITNHAIFNLGGSESVEDILRNRLFIAASRYTPVDADLIPTGEISMVDNTPFDFRGSPSIGDRICAASDHQIRLARGYDHNFVLDEGMTSEPKLAARLVDPVSGRMLDVLTTEPGLQVYTGNMYDGSIVGKGGTLYRMGAGIALEPQKFPNTPNIPAFGSARIDPGKPYHHSMIYKLSVAA